MGHATHDRRRAQDARAGRAPSSTTRWRRARGHGVRSSQKEKADPHRGSSNNTTQKTSARQRIGLRHKNEDVAGEGQQANRPGDKDEVSGRREGRLPAPPSNDQAEYRQGKHDGDQPGDEHHRVEQRWVGEGAKWVRAVAAVIVEVPPGAVERHLHDGVGHDRPKRRGRRARTTHPLDRKATNKPRPCS